MKFKHSCLGIALLLSTLPVVASQEPQPKKPKSTTKGYVKKIVLGAIGAACVVTAYLKWGGGSIVKSVTDLAGSNPARGCLSDPRPDGEGGGERPSGKDGLSLAEERPANGSASRPKGNELPDQEKSNGISIASLVKTFDPTLVDWVQKQGDGINACSVTTANQGTVLHDFTKNFDKNPSAANTLRVMLLLESHADPTVKNRHGQEPLHMINNRQDEKTRLLSSLLCSPGYITHPNFYSAYKIDLRGLTQQAQEEVKEERERDLQKLDHALALTLDRKEDITNFFTLQDHNPVQLVGNLSQDGEFEILYKILGGMLRSKDKEIYQQNVSLLQTPAPAVHLLMPYSTDNQKAEEVVQYASKDNSEQIQALLKSKIDPNVVSYRRSPLGIAIQYQSWNSMEILLHYGANIQKNGKEMSVLHKNIKNSQQAADIKEYHRVLIPYELQRLRDEVEHEQKGKNELKSS